MIELMMSIAPLPPKAQALPHDFQLRPFGPGDRSRWLEIQASTGVYGALAPALFDREFGDCASAHCERILFAERAGEAVGVSAAWHPSREVPASTGRVHWVAVKPSYQRRGLGRALVVATLRRLDELGYSSAYLTTGSENRPAISLYRSLGFKPVPRTAEERSAWQALASR